MHSIYFNEGDGMGGAFKNKLFFADFPKSCLATAEVSPSKKLFNGERIASAAMPLPSRRGMEGWHSQFMYMRVSILLYYALWRSGVILLIMLQSVQHKCIIGIYGDDMNFNKYSKL
jgi:hypothetical protein